MRIVFMGTPGFAVPALDALAAAGHAIVAVYSQPPRPGGRRGRSLVPSPVHARADALGVPVLTPVSLRDPATQATFAGHEADVAVVAAYGLILPPPVLAAPRLGCLNLHASLLPRWRGAAPIQRAILAGDRETGLCVMQMEAGLDTGPVLMRRRTEVAGRTAGFLTDELAAMGAEMIVEVLADIPRHPPVAQPDDGVTYATKIDKAELRLDFTLPVDAVRRQILALNPPGAWFEHDGERIRVLEADMTDEEGPPGTVMQQQGRLVIACGRGSIAPRLVQRAGRGVMPVEELLRGFAIPPGTRL